jgi:hypothetical protein
MPQQRPAKTIILHIGLEKTGTTTLQAVGGRNRAWFAKHGVLYPQTPGATNHVKLALYAAKPNRAMNLRRRVGLGDNDVFEKFCATLPANLEREVADSGCPIVWLSNEHLSSRLRFPAELDRLAALLRPLADDIRIIVYLRHQPELYLSAYSTAIKSGDDRELERVLTGNEYFYRFDKILQNWADCFGAGALTIRIFDRKTLTGGDIVPDFLSVMGLAPDADLIVPDGLNRRLDGFTVQFLRLFSRHIPPILKTGPNPEYGDACTLLESVSTGPDLALPAETMRHIAALFAPSNEAVARQFLRREDGKLFREKDYANINHTASMTAAEARKIGLALCDAKLAQVASFARAPQPAAPDSLARLRNAHEVEEIVEAASEVWRARQTALLQLRKARRVKAL